MSNDPQEETTTPIAGSDRAVFEQDDAQDGELTPEELFTRLSAVREGIQGGAITCW
jgi:hypothetical protein